MSEHPGSSVVGTVVCLPVRDLQVALRFYQGVFDMPDLVIEEGMITVELPGLSLFLLEEENFASYSRKAGREVSYPGDAAGTGVILSCAIATRENLDSMLAAAVDHGGGVPKPAAIDPEVGLYLGYFFDPDGHHWELAHSERG